MTVEREGVVGLRSKIQVTDVTCHSLYLHSASSVCPLLLIIHSVPLVVEQGTRTKPHGIHKQGTPHSLRCQNGQTNKLDHPPPPPYLGEIIA